MPKHQATWAVLWLLLIAPCHVAAQGRERVVNWFRTGDAFEQALTKDGYGKTVTTDLAVFEIVAFSVGGKSVTPGRPFAAAEDWMKDLRVRARNISPKPIARASLGFLLPEARHGDGFLSVSLHFGKRLGPCVGGAEPEVAAPGEEFELAMTKADYERRREWIADWTGVTSISRAEIEAVTLIFDDCTPWASALSPRNARPAPR